MMKRFMPKSEFGRNVLTLMGGTTISQAIPIIIMPILTRIYTPEDFGTLALFVAVTGVLGSIANARYEIAITLPEKDEDAIEVAALGVVIALMFSLFLFIPFVFFNQLLTDFLNNSNISLWLYFVPLVVLTIGIFNILNYLNVRLRRYKDIAKANVYKSVAMVSVQIFFGLMNGGVTGLILGQIASSLGSVFRLSKNIDIKLLFFKLNNRGGLKSKAIRYKRFFIYMLPASLMNALSSNLITLAIPSLFAVKTLGLYSLAQRTLGIPMSLIGSSVSQVYVQEASEERKKTGKVILTFKKTLMKLFFLSVLLFVPLYFLIEDLFAIAFGENWRIAGFYAKELLPYFALNFIVSSLSVTDSIMEKQYVYAIFNVVNLLSTLVVIYIFGESFEVFIKSFVCVFSINYIVYLVVTMFIAKGGF